MTDDLNKLTTFYKKSFDLGNIRERIKDLFDLSENEISLYMILLTSDNLTANELSKITEIQRTRIYEIIRNLKEKELVTLLSENPQRYGAVSPRISIDKWLNNNRNLFEERNSMLLSLLPNLQMIWNDQHEELLTSRISLISEDLVRDVIPQEIKLAKYKLCLALKDPEPINQQTSNSKMFARLFDPQSFTHGIHSFLKRGVLLNMLIGDSELFLNNSHPMMVKTLVSGLLDGVIEVKALDIPFPQSFLLVDDEKIFLFFLNSIHDSYNEALRAENKSLIDFFKLVWQKLWKDAIPLKIETVIEKLDSLKPL